MRSVVALLLCASLASAGTVVVVNKGAASATLLDRATGRVVATLPTGQGPHEVATSPDGAIAVVTNYGVRGAPGRSLTVLDLKERRVEKTIHLGKYRRPHGVAFLPDGRVAVTAEGNQALIVVDLKKGEVAQEVPTAQMVSHMVALGPKGERAYVANIYSGSLTAIDLKEGRRLESLATGKGAEGVCVSPDGSTVWVSNRADGTVSVVDAEKLEVVASLPCPGFPIRAVFTPDGARVLVSCARSGDLAVFDAKTRKQERRIPLADPEAEQKDNMFRQRGPLPIGVLVAPDGRHAFVACGGYDRLAVIDLETWKVVARWKTGREPDGLAFVSE